MRRSVSPIVGTHASTQNLSSHPSFMSLPPGGQGAQMDGGAVMAPRKKRVVSRSKSKTTTKSKTAMSNSLPIAPITAQSHANFTPIRQAYG